MEMKRLHIIAVEMKRIRIIPVEMKVTYSSVEVRLVVESNKIRSWTLTLLQLGLNAQCLIFCVPA